jgi:hypothetical protein
MIAPLTQKTQHGMLYALSYGMTISKMALSLKTQGK